MQINSLESDFLNKHNYIIAIDEAGRGPWAGPVTVGAILIDIQKLYQLSTLEFLNDSKKLSHKKRAVLENQILENILDHSIQNISAQIIDEINILEATKLGIEQCIKELITHNSKIATNSGILIDGKFIFNQDFYNNSRLINCNFTLKTVVDGDALCVSIAAASILAKEHRDNLMQEMHLKYPEYGFDKHKGYGTKHHHKMLKIFGPCDEHRKSFRPVKELF